VSLKLGKRKLRNGLSSEVFAHSSHDHYVPS